MIQSVARSRLLGKRIVLLVSSTVLSLLAAELVLRGLFEFPTLNPKHHRVFCEYDELLGWRKIPTGFAGRR